MNVTFKPSGKMKETQATPVQHTYWLTAEEYQKCAGDDLTKD